MVFCCDNKEEDLHGRSAYEDEEFENQVGQKEEEEEPVVVLVRTGRCWVLREIPPNKRIETSLGKYTQMLKSPNAKPSSTTTTPKHTNDINEDDDTVSDDDYDNDYDDDDDTTSDDGYDDEDYESEIDGDSCMQEVDEAEEETLPSLVQANDANGVEDFDQMRKETEQEDKAEDEDDDDEEYVEGTEDEEDDVEGTEDEAEDEDMREVQSRDDAKEETDFSPDEKETDDEGVDVGGANASELDEKVTEDKVALGHASSDGNNDADPKPDNVTEKPESDEDQVKPKGVSEDKSERADVLDGEQGKDLGRGGHLTVKVEVEESCRRQSEGAYIAQQPAHGFERNLSPMQTQNGTTCVVSYTTPQKNMVMGRGSRTFEEMIEMKEDGDKKEDVEEDEEEDTFAKWPEELIQEYEDMQQVDFTTRGYYAKPASLDDPYAWEGVLSGPSGTPYEGGIFGVSLHLSNSYPEEPPTVRFKTPIYHANVDTYLKGGRKVSMKLLNPTEWKESFSSSTCREIVEEKKQQDETTASRTNPPILSVMENLRSILKEPEIGSPACARVELGEQFLERPNEYNRIARLWTKKLVIEQNRQQNESPVSSPIPSPVKSPPTNVHNHFM